MLKDKYKGLVDMKYIYYYMDKVDTWCKENTYQSSFQAVDMDGFRTFLIPIPSLEIQQDIVSLFDDFYQLIEIMNEEFETRKQQLEYYHDMIMSFKESVHD